jgi:hypothetical protein
MMILPERGVPRSKVICCPSSASNGITDRNTAQSSGSRTRPVFAALPHDAAPDRGAVKEMHTMETAS